MNDRLSRRQFVKNGIGMAALSLSAFPTVSMVTYCAAQAETPKKALPHATWDKLPRWRGFNLCEKFTLGGAQPFREDDFRNISDLGFNFVRLPMDYRIWTDPNNKRNLKENALSEIDQALEFGQKYGVHVQFNFHRAPGYTVNNPPEEQSVWHDEEILDVCRFHWQTFAKRYCGVSSDSLSFNLFNEPAGCSEDDYYRVVKTIVDAIRIEDSERLIICDGINWGGSPCLSFKNLKVGQATRGYAPMEISHWGANWVNSRDFPTPQWPMFNFNALLPSRHKREMPADLRKPLEISGDFDGLEKLRFTVGTVSSEAELVVLLDGQETFRKRFKCGPGKGEWKEARFVEEYGIYANIYDMELSIPVSPGTKKVEIAVVEGDWLTISKITFVSSNGDETSATGVADWNASKQTQLQYLNKDGRKHIAGGVVRDRSWLFENNVKPWVDAQKSGIGVMVGEFGAYNKTPHKIVLDWMEDMLANWRDANWGWALWNFRGSFGIADSERNDVEYEDWRGMKLDRKMLALLQRY